MGVNTVAGGAQPRPQFGGALHPAFSALRHVGADRLFPGVALDKMRCPWTLHTFNPLGLKTFLYHSTRTREPQLSRRLGRPHDNSFSWSKDGTCLMRLPDMGGACAPIAATSFRLTVHGQRPDR
jgi:hypothetical protein